VKPCMVCGGPRYLLGSLGNRRHYRCRNCGMGSSHVVRRRVRKVTEEVLP
jgi:hypothetical protein